MNAAGPAGEEAGGTELQEEKIPTSPTAVDGGAGLTAVPLSPPSVLPAEAHNDRTDADDSERSTPASPEATSPPPPPPPPPPPRRALPRTSSSSPVATTATAAAAAHLLKKQQEQRAAAPGPIPPNRRRLRIYPTGRNRTNKWVTREIAALDFLTGLRMRNEAAILAQGTSGGGVGGGIGIGGGGDVSVGDADSSSLLGNSGGGGAAGDNKGGGGWGWDVRKGSDGGGSENSYGEAAARGGVSPAGDGGRNGGSGGEAIVKDSVGRSIATGGGGGGGGGNIDNDDTDSENGWLDQPLPSSDRGGVDSGGNGNRSAQQLRGASSRSSVGIGRVSGAGVGGPAPARRLRGREAAHVRLPPTFRHSMQSLPGHSAAVVRQWEQGLTRQVHAFACMKATEVSRIRNLWYSVCKGDLYYACQLVVVPLDAD